MPTAPTKRSAVKLTKSYIDRLQPGPKETFLWCSDPKGFGVRVNPTGKISFVVQGRIVGGAAAARITIGPYGVFTVEQARDVAREHLRSMRMGIDPRDVRKQEDAMAITLRQVANAYFARPGPRVAEGIELLAHLFHPDLFVWPHQHQPWAQIA